MVDKAVEGSNLVDRSQDLIDAFRRARQPEAVSPPQSASLGERTRVEALLFDVHDQFQRRLELLPHGILGRLLRKIRVVILGREWSRDGALIDAITLQHARMVSLETQLVVTAQATQQRIEERIVCLTRDVAASVDEFAMERKRYRSNFKELEDAVTRTDSGLLAEIEKISSQLQSGIRKIDDFDLSLKDAGRILDRVLSEAVRDAQTKREIEGLRNTIVEQGNLLKANVSDVETRIQWLHQLAEEQRSRRESIRSEILWEISNDTRTERDHHQSQILETWERPIRLNLGSGTKLEPTYINVDIRAIEGVDLVADVLDLPFAGETVAEIRTAHVLEHFPRQTIERKVIPYWTSLLEPSGYLRVIVPDWEMMLDGYSREEVSWDDLIEVTFGGQEYNEDYHFHMFSVESMCTLLKDSGLVIVATTSGRRNGKTLELEVLARRE